ncbi:MULTISPECIES: carboxylating nicotinate-nucleotide diphosphorylase [Methylophaga]|jgi:nicotinate-nucleotide pyrophosphorylase (carboxylating)|uniref:nicotinate-nucleotide diphosphorylase (carboxylating) n=1 Tax=Methylophaga marina TaxID=45495 RepID=A0ABP3D0H7_9GAMM|nr:MULTISPECIES: carboxylating nicotinate-nucleotide diphosphorylase [Methylophaga]BDZ72698.1 nicotinate-nucleotide diphosphorylase (carboxylating) [Methylophaga marina]|tara:strand:+ start:3887 stop:4729 length:843 start_codon:yes stop_codon:yes gene_type:complete
MTIENPLPAAFIASQVKLSLLEDIGQEDLTANLIPADAVASATLITREDATLCGMQWFNSVFEQLDASISVNWKAQDGDRVKANSILCELHGPARSLLTGERTAMNFLQTLSATATLSSVYADAVSGLPVKILDTRKTIPGWRVAQKYAVKCGGCFNHRVGLYDGILIKENHIMAAGSIERAVHQAKALSANVPIEVEVESLAELKQALVAGADIILLDNFTIDDLKQAVTLNKGQSELEASGGITLGNIRSIAETGVDRISVGALTKDIKAVDLSMRFS